MGYEEARSALATTLATVAITDPVAQTVKKVYDDPPGTIGDRPCFIMYGSSGVDEHNMGGSTVLEIHTERVRFLTADAKLDVAARLVRAFRKATLAALKTAGGLGGHATVNKLAWDEPSSFLYGDKNFTGQDYLITFYPKAP